MNKVLEGRSHTDQQEYIDQGYGINQARDLVVTDRMFSAIVRVEMHIDEGELEEAVRLQNDLLMLLITETRGKR